MSLNIIPENSPIISQPVNDNFNYLESIINNVITDNIGYGVKSGLLVTAQASPNMIVTIGKGVAYLPNGKRATIDQTNLTIKNPTAVLHSGEVHTTNTSGVFTTDLKPIVTSIGKYANTSDITVVKSADNSAVAVSTVTSTTGSVDTVLTSAISVKATYYHGQKRIDVIILTEQGGLQIVNGTPSNTTPLVPSLPPMSLKIAEIKVNPKSTISVEAADITNTKINNGFYIDGDGNIVIGKDLIVLGSQSIGNVVNESVIIRDKIYNDLTGLPLKIDDDLNVVGNITLIGTVDGRDVATDGNSLDTHLISKASTASTNATLDKHVSDALAKGWEDHKKATGNSHSTSHNQLSSIGAVDVVSTDAIKDKHISNVLAKGWEDHKNSAHLALGATVSTAYRGDRGTTAYNHSILTGNSHNTSHAQLSGIGVVNTASVNTALDKHVSDVLAKGWEDHKKATGNAHSLTHAQLSSVGVADITSIDNVKDKHVSNLLAKGWEDHKNATAPHTGHATTTALSNHTSSISNPHNVAHGQTNPTAVSIASTNTTFDRHVSDALAKGWEDHKKATGNAHSLTHAQLSGIGNIDITSIDNVTDKHVSDVLAKGWEDHKNATAPHTGHATTTALNSHVSSISNPHKVTHSQTSPAVVDITSTNAVFDKHVSSVLAKGWEDHKNSAHLALGATSLTAYRGDRGTTAYNHSISTGNSHSLNHAQILEVGTVDLLSDDIVSDKHVSNVLAKGWEDHKNATGNVHSTSHSQLSSVGVVDITSANATLDKHVSNVLAKGWEDHKNATAPHTGHATVAVLNAHTSNKANPHSITHTQTSPIAVNILSTNVTLDKHVSDVLAKGWEDHKNATAPHSGHVPISHVGSGGNSHALVSGSVNGFMSSANYNKLSGIEAGATADMTASEILTALKTADGVGSGLDADLLGGTSSSGYSKTSHTHDDRYYTESEINTSLGLKLNASNYTASDILTKIKTVDGIGSGLDADTVSGMTITVASIAPLSPKKNDIFIDIS